MYDAEVARRPWPVEGCTLDVEGAARGNTLGSLGQRENRGRLFRLPEGRVAAKGGQRTARREEEEAAGRRKKCDQVEEGSEGGVRGEQGGVMATMARRSDGLNGQGRQAGLDVRERFDCGCILLPTTLGQCLRLRILAPLRPALVYHCSRSRSQLISSPRSLSPSNSGHGFACGRSAEERLIPLGAAQKSMSRLIGVSQFSSYAD